MFGFGSKKKIYLEEFATALSQLGSIDISRAREFTSEYRSWVLSETFDRKLDPLIGAWNVAEKSLERIVIAHRLSKFEAADMVPNFMLLVALNANHLINKMAMEIESPAPMSSYLDQVLTLPVSIDDKEYTYARVLADLVDGVVK